MLGKFLVPPAVLNAHSLTIDPCMFYIDLFNYVYLYVIIWCKAIMDDHGRFSNNIKMSQPSFRVIFKIRKKKLASVELKFT